MRLNAKRLISPVVALGLGFSALGLAQGITPSFAAAPAVSPTLSPPANQTAVANGHKVTFGGTAEPGSEIVFAGLRFLDKNGKQIHVPADELAPPEPQDIDVTPRAMISSDGRISGDMTIPSPLTGLNDGTVHLVLVVERAGERSPEVISNGVAIDLVRPFILRTELVQNQTAVTDTERKTKVRVTFSESVVLPGPTSEQALNELLKNWQLCNVDDCNPQSDSSDNHPATSVEGSGISRVFTFASVLQIDEDAIPRIGYFPAPKDSYRDRAWWSMGVQNWTTTAIDKVAPLKIPAIQSLAGDPDGDAISNDRTPTVVLGNLRQGHVGQVYLETSDPADGFQAGADALLGEAAAGSNGLATVTVADDKAFQADGPYVLYGVARDRAKCNPSDNASLECPNHSVADPGFYSLDTVAPTALFVLSDIRDADHADPIVRVRFSEGLEPQDGDAGDWSIPGITVEAVTGTGDERILDVSAPVPTGVPVSYTKPQGGGGALGGAVLGGDAATPYLDPAGNELESFQEAAVNGIPPLVFIDSPANHLWTQQNSIEISGRTEQAQWVRIYRKNGDALEPLSLIFTPNGSFRAPVNLTSNAANMFAVQGFRCSENPCPRDPVTGDPIPTVAGEIVDVPACDEPPCAVVQDSINPQLGDLVMGRALPDQKRGFKGNEPTTITWSASDANMGPTPIRVEFSSNGGNTWLGLGEGAMSNNNPTLPWLVPAVDTENARIRVTVTDQAQRKTTKLSNPFVIDSSLPTFGSTTVDPTHVHVVFSERVVDSPNQLKSLEWTIDADGPGNQPPVPVDADAVPTGGPGMISGLMLETGLVNGMPQQLPPNSTPEVTYIAADEQEQVVKQVKDRVGNLIEDTRTTALDGIAPRAVSGATARKLVRQTSEPINGTVPEHDSNNKIVARRSGAAFSAPVRADGTFTVMAGLVRDRVNTFQLSVEDKAGNASPAFAVSLENDSTAPKISVRKPQVRKSRGKRYIRIKWSSVEPHKSSVKIEFKSTGSAFARKVRMVVKSTADDGSFIWRAPSWLKGRKVKVFVTGTDSVGNARRVASRTARVR